MTDISLEQKWQLLIPTLNEKQLRYYLASEAKALGVTGPRRISKATGISRQTIYVGIREIESGEILEGERARRPGGGRKKLADKDPTIIKDLEDLIDTDDETGNPPKGNPMNFVKWTNKSTAKLTVALQKMGHKVHDSAPRSA